MRERRATLPLLLHPPLLTSPHQPPTSLATVESLSRQVAEYAERNRELQASVRQQVALNASAADDKGAHLQSGFQQGVVWLGRQALAASDELSERIAQLSLAAQKQGLEACVGMPPPAAAVVRHQASWFVQFEDAVVRTKKKLRQLFEVRTRV